MQISVRLSGELARVSGTARLALDLTDGATVDDARRVLLERLPELSGALAATLPLIRGTHVGAGHGLRHGDELALLRPAAGGEIPR